jgi:hypothetical protein
MRFIFISLSLSLLLLGSAAISKGCCTLFHYSIAAKQERISIFPTTNEVLRWDLKSEFFDGPDLTYKLSDPNIKQFKVINPIELTGTDTTHKYRNTLTYLISCNKYCRCKSQSYQQEWLLAQLICIHRLD